MRRTSKAWRFLSSLFVFVLILAACSAPAAAPAESSGGDTGASESGAAMADLPDDAAAEQVLRINSGSVGATNFRMYPMAGGGDMSNWQAFVWTGPLYFDADLNLQPGVFDTWTPNDDFTEWTFTIDPAAVWSDGTPITAEDVVGTWTLMTDPLNEHSRIPQFIGNVLGFAEERESPDGEIEGLEAVDDSTVHVTLVNPDAIFHWRIATTLMNPVKFEQAVVNPLDFWLPENNPVSSGPYMMESFDPDLQEVILVPNPNWWKDEGPYLERIEIRFQPEPEITATMLQNDQVDASMSPLPNTFRDQFPDYFRPVNAFGFNSFWLAATVPPTDDINVRKALILSVDGDAVFKAAFPEGYGAKATSLIDPDLPCQETEMEWWPFDVEAAKQAIAESEYGSVENLPKIRVTPRGTDTTNNRALEAIMEQWRQNLGLTNVEFQQRPDGFGDDADQINLSRDDINIRFPDAATYVWVGAHSEGPIARGSMMKGYENPEIDAILDEALSLGVDDPRRCELTLQAQRMFMEDYQMLFIGVPPSVLLARDHVANYQRGPDALIEPWKIYIREH